MTELYKSLRPRHFLPYPIHFQRGVYVGKTWDNPPENSLGKLEESLGKLVPRLWKNYKVGCPTKLIELQRN